MIFLILSNTINTYLDNSITSIVPPTDKSMEEIWLPCIFTLIGCLLSAGAIVWTNSRQIRNTNLLLKKTMAKEEINIIRTTLAKYIAVINQDSGQLINMQYISNEHKLLEASLSILLDSDDRDEKLLLSTIKKFHHTKIYGDDMINWISEIETQSNKVISNYKNK